MERASVLRKHLSPSHNGGERNVNDFVSPSDTSGLQFGGEILAEYDVIVVGAGSAGCVVASRLSEDPKVNVLLIEAGGDHRNFRVRWPLVTNAKLQNSEYDWAYRTTPQKHTANRVSHQPRGKTLGGSSSINYMLYVRGDPRNWDQYANEDGCGEQWSYKEILPYFKKSEGFQGSEETINDLNIDSHGFDGPLTVTAGWDPRIKTWSQDASNRFVSSCDEFGIPRNTDYNGPVQDGASLSQVTVHDGKRMDTATAFLFKNDALKRPNLTVLGNAHVCRIVMQGSRATGVIFKTGSSDSVQMGTHAYPSRFVGARKEVVVSGGAYASPQLLMLSGIGPKQHLEEMKIPVVIDLPGVGQNLQDHLMTPVIYEAEKSSTVEQMNSPFTIVKAFFEFFFLAQGIFMLPFVTAVAFFQSGLRKPEDGNDLQIHYVPYITQGEAETGKINLGYDADVNPRFDQSLNPTRGVCFLASLIRPLSSGSVTLRSNNPFDHPKIDPRYLEHPQDMEAMKICYKKCREIAKKAAAHQGFLGKEKINPFTKHKDPESDEYIEESIREEVVTIYHPAGTCKMGDITNDLVVVDAQTLKVKGTDNLRIADTSVLPHVPSGNTNAPAIVVAEKCAALIKSQYR